MLDRGSLGLAGKFFMKKSIFILGASALIFLSGCRFSPKLDEPLPFPEVYDNQKINVTYLPPIDPTSARQITDQSVPILESSPSWLDSKPSSVKFKLLT